MKFRILTIKTMLILLNLIIIACTATTNQSSIPALTDLKFWTEFQHEWIDMDVDPYKLYVFHNINEFNAAPEDIKQHGIEKWQAFYPQDAWPPDNPPKKIGSGPFISGKQIGEAAKIIIPAIMTGIVTNGIY